MIILVKFRIYNKLFIINCLFLCKLCLIKIFAVHVENLTHIRGLMQVAKSKGHNNIAEFPGDVVTCQHKTYLPAEVTFNPD